MAILTPRIHGYLDYLTVVIFALAPTLFGLTGVPALLAYLLAVVHLLMTLLTDFPLGVADVIPLRWHSRVELIVSVVLVVLPWLLGDLFSAGARTFYTAIGAVIFVVWLATDYVSNLSYEGEM